MTTSELMYLNNLQCENHDLKQELEAFRNGEKYRKLRHEYEMVIRGKDRRIRDLEIELSNLCIHHKNQREQWFSDNERWLADYRKEVDQRCGDGRRGYACHSSDCTRQCDFQGSRQSGL